MSQIKSGSRGRRGLALGFAVCLAASTSHRAVGQGVSTYHPCPPPLTADALVRMTPAELDWLYRSSEAGFMPRGRVKGRVIISPGTPMAPTTSRVARLWWQGKVFRDDGSTAVNRFVGLPIVEGSTYVAQSWMDGRPSLILDYQHTSFVYKNVRDEIRQVGPGLYLGAMFDRTQPAPSLRMYFVLETNP